MADGEIFDRALRRLRRDRAARIGDDFLHAHMAEELLDRLADVQRPFDHVLDLGCGPGTLSRALAGRGMRVISVDAGMVFARAAGGVVSDEDRLGIADGAVDLVVSAGALDTVNDLPGALALARRVLRPDGLFLGAFVGAGSLPRLRTAMMAADLDAGIAAPRIHPQIDVRSAGDLLARAGFALPVADGARLEVRYRDLFGLVRDLRTIGATNLMLARDRRALGQHALAVAAAEFARQADPDGRITEHFEIVYLTGWAPDASQPRAARRGSGRQSLADVLGRFPRV